MADTTVRCINSSMTGGGYTVPTVSGTAGSLLNVLDFCLVNGGATQTVDSVVILSNIATVTRAAGHPFEAGSCANLAGATVTGGSINGLQRVLSVTSTTYTFEVALSNQTATGTILHNVPSLGWSLPFTGTNLRAYRSTNVASLQYYLKVDDTGTTDARITGFETMSSISDVAGNQFPTTAQISGGLYWPKSSASSAAVRNWTVIGDDRSFILWVEYHSSGVITGNVSFACGFGDLTPVRSSSSQYDCYLSGFTTSFAGQSAPLGQELACFAADAGFYMARSMAGAVISQNSGSTIQSYKRPAMFLPSLSQFTGGGSHAYPDPSGNIILTPIQVVEGTSAQASLALRGYIPGINYCLQNIGNFAFIGIPSIINITNSGNRRYKCLNQAYTTGYGPLFIDMTGPWR